MKKSKKRVFLYILIVLFTAAMAAEGALVFLSRNTGSAGGLDMSSFQLPDGTSFQTDGTMPQGDGTDFQSGETMPQMDGTMPQMDGAMPQGGGDMPSQNAGADSQTGETTGDTSFRFGGGQMGDMSNMPSFDSIDTSTLPGSTSTSGILSTLRRFWIPIIAVCLLGDIICLILLRRDKKAARQAEEAAAAAADDDAPPRRKKKKWWLVPVCIVLIITVALSSLPQSATVTQGDTVTVDEEVISGTAEAGTITTVLTGAGTISPETTVSVTIPSVVEVKTYHVQNGDQVYAGDVLATLDTTGLVTAIAELQEVLDELDEDLESERQTSASSYISAPVSGRVKAILAKVGDDAAQVTASEGALLLLSVDGLMKVEISTDGLTTGEKLTVRLDDGTELTGRVSSSRNGITVVTVSDETAPYGGNAKVYSSSGKLLGTGTLEINSELKVTGTYGTISSVAVSVNQEVSQSTTLFYLTDVGYTQEYQTLLARREELEAQMDTLYALYPDGQVIAETDGIVSDIPDDADYVALNSGDETVTADTLTAGGSWTIVLLSSTETGTETSGSDHGAESAGAESVTNSQPTGETTADAEAPAEANTGASTISETEAPTETATEAPTEAVTEAPTEESTEAPTEAPTTPSTDTSTEATGFYATVTRFEMDETGARIAVILTRMDTGAEVRFDGTMSENNTALTLNDLNAGDILYVSTEGTSAVRTYKKGGESYPDPTTPSSEEPTTDGSEETFPSGGGDFSGGSSGGGDFSGGSSGGTSTSTTSQSSYDTYSIATTTVLTLASQETMVVEIPVDELDVLSLTEGSEAQVTLDAVKGQTFTGTVSHISRTGTNSGGNTKYTVEITLPGSDEMISGMNASVSVTTATTEAAITVPAAALYEVGGKTYIYTDYSEKDDTLLNPVEVETGVADADTVEILSGLNEGDTYYYRYASGITYTFTI